MTKKVVIMEENLDNVLSKKNDIDNKFEKLGIGENINEIIFTIKEGSTNDYLQKMIKLLDTESRFYPWPKQVRLNFANCYLKDSDTDLLLKLITSIPKDKIQITHLNFEGNDFSDVIIDKLKPYLSNKCGLWNLNLEGTKVSENGLEVLANIVTTNNRLTTVKVNEELKELTIYNKLCLLLKITSFFNNDKEDNKVFVIKHNEFIKTAKFLNKKRDLIRIAISNIDEENAEDDSISNFLKTHPTLTYVSVQKSTLTDSQAISLYQSFLENPRLTTLRFFDTVTIHAQAIDDNQSDTVMSDNDDEDSNNGLDEAKDLKKDSLATIIKSLAGQKLNLERYETKTTKLTLLNNKKQFIFYAPIDIVDAAAIAISSNQFIKCINLANRQLSTENLYEIFHQAKVGNLHTAVTLDFSKNSIDLKENTKLLAQIISQSAHSITLKLTDNPIENESLRLFYETLLKSTTLESRAIAPKNSMFSFVFKSNKAQDTCITLEFKDDIKFAAALIARSNTIHTFSYPNCTDDQLKALIEDGLTQNQSITTLNLMDSKLTADGIAKLAKLVEDNHGGLAHLNFSYTSLLTENRLAAADITSLVLALKTNTRLISLNLNNTAIDDSIFETLKDPLSKNKTLTCFEIRNADIINDKLYYGVTYAGIIEFIKFLKTKPMKKHANLLEISYFLFNEWVAKSYKNITWLKKKPKELVDPYLTINRGKRDKFISYVNEGKQSGIEESLKEVSFYATDSAGNYPLHITIEKGHLSLVEYFLSQDYNLYLTDKNGKTALELAQQKAQLNNGDQKFIDIQNAIKNKLALPSSQQASSKKTPLATRKKTPAKKRPVSTENEVDTERHIKKYKGNTGASAPVVNQANDDVSQESDNEAGDKGLELAISSSRSVRSPTSNSQLFDYVATGNDYQLKRYLNRDNVNSIDEDNHTLLYVAAQQGQLAIVKLLLDYGADCNQPVVDEKPLTAIIERILSQGDNRRDALLIASLLVRQGATIANTELLHQVVQAGHYRLMKILLSASDCKVNKLNEQSATNKISGLSALDVAVEKQDRLMIERLAIDRRLAAHTLSNARDRANKLPCTSTTEAIVQFLTKRIEQSVPEAKPGIQWTQQTCTFFGAQSSKLKKQVQVNSQKALAYLAMKHPHIKKGLPSYLAYLDKLAKEKENVNTNKQSVVISLEENDISISDNPVTASLVFIVSKTPYKPQQVEERTKIRIMLDCKKEHHLAKSNINHKLEEEFEKIVHRAASAPPSIFENGTFEQRKGNALSPDEIKETYLPYIEGEDKGKGFDYNQTFHHGEQSLFDDIENSEMIDSIVKQLANHPKFVQGCKIYAVVLELYSPRYPCVNCEAAILGEQNSDKSKFLQGLANKLQEYRCTIPQLGPLRMVTVVSSHRPCDSDVLAKDDHKILTLDIRSVHHNDVILARDESAFRDDYEMTSYHSTAPKK